MTWVYLDGEYVPATEARVATGDSALLYGRGLFETLRARRGAVYLLDRHIDRLEAGARVLGIAVPPAVEGLEAIVRELAERQCLEDARVRLTLTAGSESEPSVLFVQARAVTDYPERVYEKGLSAHVASVRRNETSPLARVKSLSCLDNLLAKEKARASGVDDAILLNTRELLAEGSTSNLFLIRDGQLLTPPIADGALPGITRGAVWELAEAAGIIVRELSMTMDDLRHADEAFLTNSVGGVMPLVSVDGSAVGSGSPGEVTGRLRALYEAAATA